jgi:hypothetical protein
MSGCKRRDRGGGTGVPPDWQRECGGRTPRLSLNPRRRNKKRKMKRKRKKKKKKRRRRRGGGR